MPPNAPHRYRKAKPADKAQRFPDSDGPYVELSLAGASGGVSSTVSTARNPGRTYSAKQAGCSVEVNLTPILLCGLRQDVLPRISIVDIVFHANLDHVVIGQEAVMLC